MKNKNFIYVLIALITYVVIISFPTYLIIPDDVVMRYVIEVILRGAYLVFIILFSILTKIAKSYTGRTKYWNMLLLAPLFIVAFFNLFYHMVVLHEPFSALGDQIAHIFYSDGVQTYEILKFVCIILTVVEEELLFRYILQRNLLLRHKVNRILVTAAIYTACQFFAILYDFGGVFVVSQLWFLAFELSFIFGVGIILGFMYEYTNNIIYPIGFALLFYLCKGLLLVDSQNLVNFTYYVITYVSFSVFAIGYICLFYFLMLKKENR